MEVWMLLLMVNAVHSQGLAPALQQRIERDVAELAPRVK